VRPGEPLPDALRGAAIELLPSGFALWPLFTTSAIAESVMLFGDLWVASFVMVFPSASAADKPARKLVV
jgi:hypothetical protein